MHLDRRAFAATVRNAIGSWAIVAVVIVAMTVSSVRADAAASPEALIGEMTKQVLATVGHSEAPIDAAALHALVETAIMPNLDFRGMTARVVGPRWRSLDDAQKAQLMAGFEALLRRTPVRCRKPQMPRSSSGPASRSTRRLARFDRRSHCAAAQIRSSWATGCRSRVKSGRSPTSASWVSGSFRRTSPSLPRCCRPPAWTVSSRRSPRRRARAEPLRCVVFTPLTRRRCWGPPHCFVWWTSEIAFDPLPTPSIGK